MNNADILTIGFLLRLHAAVGEMLRAEQAYDDVRCDIAREPAAFEARKAARDDLSAAHRIATDAVVRAFGEVEAAP